MTNKLSYAWVRNTPLFKSVSTGLTFDEKHKLAVDLMVAHFGIAKIDYTENYLMHAFSWRLSPQNHNYWKGWNKLCSKTTTKQ